MLGHKEDRMQIEEYLKKQVETCRCLEPVLQESMAYSLMAGGKRIRPNAHLGLHPAVRGRCGKSTSVCLCGGNDPYVFPDS